MQNEFEKQVQQKMEDLKLVPSEPVWQKVEMQIRKKNDRRRLILWIPFGVVLIAGGLWIGIDRYLNSIAYHKSNDEIGKQNSIASPPKTTGKIIEKTANGNIEEHDKVTTYNIHQDKKISVFIKAGNSNVSLSNEPVEEKSSKKINQPKTNLFVEKERTATKNNETSFAEANVPDKIARQPVEKENVKDTVSKIIHTDSSSVIPTNKEKAEVNISKTDSAKHDTTSIKKIEAKKQAQSKWKYNLIVASGISGLNRLNLFNGEKSLAVPAYNNGSGAVTGNNQFYGPSAVKKDLAFSFGVLTKKELTKRVSFSTGFQYNYYSNTIQVGNVVNQSRTIMDFAVSQYYANAALHPYHNHYNFISLPVAFDWQLLKRTPLNFHAGLSFQYLIQTNALRFDYSTQSYFHDIKAFNRVELFSDFALTYSVLLKQKPLLFGPQLQYGLTTVEKGNSTNHLLMCCLKVQWQLKK